MVGGVDGWFCFLILLLLKFVLILVVVSVEGFGLVFRVFLYPLNNLQKSSTPASLGE